MNNKEFDYSALREAISQLCTLTDTRFQYLKGFEGFLQETYRVKYIDLLYELYHSEYEFADEYPKTLEELTKVGFKDFLWTFRRFVLNYARLLQYLEFAGVKFPESLSENYNYWKTKRSELIDYLEKNK